MWNPEQQTWSVLPESGQPGYQVWESGDRLYLNAHFGPDGGGVFAP